MTAIFAQTRHRLTKAAFVEPLSTMTNARLAGTKAFYLGRMMGLGLPIPPGFVVTREAFDAFLKFHDLGGCIAEQLRHLDSNNPGTFQMASGKIRDLVRACPLPRQTARALRVACRAYLPDVNLIVRSSAIGEDSAQASFAGQLDSLHCGPRNDELAAAVLACWSSYWSERALFYQHTGRGRLEGMAVIVQQRIRPAVSGVLFTVAPCPTPGDGAVMLGEYAFGYGDSLVSGRINPGRFAISRVDRKIDYLAPPEGNGPAVNAEFLTDSIIERLATFGRRLEDEFGQPQDIEWLVDEAGNLFVVQSRPITSAAFSPLSPHSTGKSRHGNPALGPASVYWTNANVNENYPGPISPLLYSIASASYYHYFRNLAFSFGIAPKRIAAMEEYFRQIIGVHGARMYYNLTSIHAVLRLAPAGKRLADYFDLFVGAQSGETQIPEIQASPLEWARVAAKALRQFLFLGKRVSQFESCVQRYSNSIRPGARKSLAEWQADFREFLEIRLHRWNDAALADAGSMIGYGLLKSFLEKAFPGRNQTSLLNTLLKGLPGIVSSIPPIELWRLSRQIRDDPRLATLFATERSDAVWQRLNRDNVFADFRRALNGFIEQWGFRFSGELMLTVPGFQENPSALIDLLRAYIPLEGPSPNEVLEQQNRERLLQTRNVLSALAKTKRFRGAAWLWQAPLLRLLIFWTHRCLVYRERARCKQALLYHRCRRVLLAIGEQFVQLGHLEDQEDVFLFTYDELLNYLSGSAMFPYHLQEWAAQRKKEHAELRAMQPPDLFAWTAGNYLSPECRTKPRSGSHPNPTTVLQGTSACGGEATGRAAVLRDLTEAHRLQSGEILITCQTDPGWGPVFFLIKGLVLERGGMLSHGAILAREYGIPTVVGVPEATTKIRHGQLIHLNGDAGYARPLD